MTNLKIKDVIKPFNGIFAHINAPIYGTEISPVVLDIDFIAKHGNRKISPFLAIFVENGQISDEKLTQLANYIHLKYKTNWKRYGVIHDTTYDPTVTIGTDETETTKINGRTLNKLLSNLANEMKQNSTITDQQTFSKLGSILNKHDETTKTTDKGTVTNNGMTTNKVTTNDNATDNSTATHKLDLTDNTLFSGTETTETTTTPQYSTTTELTYGYGSNKTPSSETNTHNEAVTTTATITPENKRQTDLHTGSESTTTTATHTGNNTQANDGTTNNTEQRDLDNTAVTATTDEESYSGYQEQTNDTNATTGSQTDTTKREDNTETTDDQTISRTKHMEGDMGVTPTSDLLRKEYNFWSSWNYIDAILLDAANELGLQVQRSK